LGAEVEGLKSYQYGDATESRRVMVTKLGPKKERKVTPGKKGGRGSIGWAAVDEKPLASIPRPRRG